MKKNRKFSIIYEDNDIIVIDKPAGMLSVSTDRGDMNTAYRLVNDYMSSKRARIFIVHRLDRETSGVMLFAKSEKVKLKLQENWDKMAIHRGYIAVVEGCVKAAEGKISSRLKQTKSLLVYSSSKPGDGKLAITNYRVLQSGVKYSLLELTLETGRKNQIRVHMKDMGHSVAGDKKYGAVSDPLRRLALHASVLVIKRPTTGEEMRFESPAPAGFTNIISTQKGKQNAESTKTRAD
jgi:23S rRNA pseudouridine1911/1915/1917 synthase